MRGDNLPIVDLTKDNTHGKEAKYIQINQIVGILTTKKKTTEEHIKQAEFEFIMDLKTLINKQRLTRANPSQKQHAPRGQYRMATGQFSTNSQSDWASYSLTPKSSSRLLNNY